jgi:hypothetical protein
MYKKLFFLTIITLIGLTACDLEQEVNIDLGPYESQLVVECYLQAGKPFTLLLTQSAAFFDPFPSLDDQFLSELLVDSATVVISHKGTDYVLNNELFVDFEDQKIFNYWNSELVPEDFESPFELSITSKEGDEIRATTRLLPVVPIDSIVVEFSEERDTLARVLTYFTDNADTENFYRRMLNESSLDSLPAQDFTTDDRLYDGPVVFGTGFNYVVGDTLFNTIFHIDNDYYNFLESTNGAINANFNPFGQPSPIISNLEGDGIGIFTGLSYDRRMTIIEE